MGLKIANQAYGILSAGIGAGATAIALQTGHGARFGTFSAGDYMYLTLINPSNQLEIIQCKGRSGDSLTPVARGADGTTAIAFSAGDRVECRPCNAAIQAAMMEASGNRYAVDSGAANAYIITIPVTPLAYFPGMKFAAKIANACSAASTINVNALGALNIKNADGSDTFSGQMPAGHVAEFIYDGTNARLLNPAKALDAVKWNGAVKTVSVSAPSGGADGDIWIQY